METPYSIAWAMHVIENDYFNCSYLRFYCDKAEREEASKCFQEAFDAVRMMVLRSCGKDEEFYMDDITLTGWCASSLTDDGFIATFGVLQDLNNRGWRLISENPGGVDPIKKAIRAVQQRFPSICYQGVANYIYENNWGGDEWYNEYSHGVDVSPTNEVLGKKLSSALKSEDFWMSLGDELQLCPEEDFAEVLEFFRFYSDYIHDDTVERLLKLAEAEDPAIREALEQELDESPIG